VPGTFRPARFDLKLFMKTTSSLVLSLLALSLPCALHAWDYEGHRLVNQTALAALPADFPDFVRVPENAERIAFLAGEPDRWRNVPDNPLQHANGMDHYLDLEELDEAGLDPAKVPSFRLDFAVQFAAARAAHSDRFPKIDPAKNTDHSREWPGFAPWAITEMFGKLRSGFSYLRAFEELGHPDEVANARASIVYIMGVMGHYVGDCSQPLHATVHHHGWVGPNPNGYSTWPGIHSWVDGGFIAKAKIQFPELKPRITPARSLALAPEPDGRDPVFVAVMNYLLATHARVEPLYELEKAGKLGHHEQPIVPEGRDFIDGQLLAGGEMLATLWVTAWKTSVPDTYLRNQLANRKARENGLMPPPPSPLPAKK
jgi:hypothetical protein